MMKKSFLNTALKNMKTTGAISPSSPFLIKSMLKHVDFDDSTSLIELGAGKGNITKAILQKMNEDCHLHSFEINQEFYNQVMKIEDERLELLLESAENLHEHLPIQSVDAVISSLPLAIFSNELKNDIFSSIKKVLKEDGVFVQFQYSLSDYKFIKREFEEVNLKMSVLNIPPAFVYVGRKMK